jgi:hypothetical protein
VIATGAEKRIALYMDVENLVHDLRETGDYGGANELITGLVRDVERRGVAVAKVAYCDASLARLMAFGLAEVGVRTFPHHGGGTDVADRLLVGEISHGLPDSVDVVVIASGDHYFADIARALRAKGKSVVVVAREGSLSWELRRAADEVVSIGTPAPVAVAA